MKISDKIANEMTILLKYCLLATM